MSRMPFVHIPWGIYSVVSKCNNSEFMFDSSDKFDLYIKHLLFCKQRMGFKMFDMVCMSNHVHEIYQVTEKVTISNILQRVKGGFARIYNAKYSRQHHFWKNKPFYRCIQNEIYMYASMNYFHWNPVRAGMVTHPSQWPYSGYQVHIMKKRSGPMIRLLDPVPGYSDEPDEYFFMIKRLKEIISAKGKRFIGDEIYCKEMHEKYYG